MRIWISAAATAVPGAHWWWLAGLGLIHSGACYVLMYSAYPRLPVGTLAVVAFVYPGVALAAAAMGGGGRATRPHGFRPLWPGATLLACGDRVRTRRAMTMPQTR